MSEYRCERARAHTQTQSQHMKIQIWFGAAVTEANNECGQHHQFTVAFGRDTFPPLFSLSIAGDILILPGYYRSIHSRAIIEVFNSRKRVVGRALTLSPALSHSTTTNGHNTGILATGHSRGTTKFRTHQKWHVHKHTQHTQLSNISRKKGSCSRYWQL